MKEFILYLYLLFSLFFLAIRASSYNKPVDCEFRYVDILFPLSRLACPVDGFK